MSLSLRDHLRVGIGPSRIDVLRVRAGWGASATAQESLGYAVLPSETHAQAIRSALKSVLSRPLGTRMRCAVVLSNYFARFAVLPWRPEITDRTARAVYARARLAQAYGAAAANWEIVEDDSSYGLPTAVCAIDVDALEAVRGGLHDCNCTLSSLEPFFSAAFNRCRSQIRDREFWFAVAEPERICLAHVSRGSLTLVRAQRVSRSVAADLASMMDRETLVAGDTEDAKLYVFAPDLPSGMLNAPAGTTARHFDPQAYLSPVGGDARYALALA